MRSTTVPLFAILPLSATNDGQAKCNDRPFLVEAAICCGCDLSNRGLKGAPIGASIGNTKLTDIF